MKGTKYMCNKRVCVCIKTISIFALFFLVIALIVVMIVINPTNEEKNVLVATAVSRR